MLYYCIAVPRCGLCRFEIEDGDLVVVGTDVEDVSAEFRFRKGCDAGVAYMYYPVHACCRPCRYSDHGTTVVPCHHASCFRLNPSGVSQELLSVTAHDFEDLAVECRRREAFFQPFVERLREAFAPRYLPPELWLQIAGYLFRECAVITAQNQVQKYKGKPEDYLIDLSKDVYARYVLFDGVRYVQSIRNATESEVEEGEYRILDAARAGTVDRIYTAFDHFGIRQLQFASPNRVLSGPDAIPGVWWKHLLRNEVSDLSTEADALKLRSINVSDSVGAGPNSQCCIAWPVRNPGPVDFLPRWDGFREDQRFRSDVQSFGTIPADIRMMRIECNSPGTSGYSAASVDGGVCFLHAHWNGEANPDYGRLGSSVSHWIYMPMNPGEYVKEIWAWSNRLGANKSVGLTFVTDQGRATSFGPSMEPMWRHRNYDYECIYEPQQSGSPIYFNVVNPAKVGSRTGRVTSQNIFHLAFENPGPAVKRERRAHPESLIPTSPPMEVEGTEERPFFSSCRLENIVEVTLCRSRGGYPDSIIGMLVRYASGDRACVGAFRFDWASEPCQVGEADMLYIGCSQELGWVKDVRLRPPPEDSELSWMVVPLHGKLEWWFTRKQSVVYHITARAVSSGVPVNLA